MSFEIQLLIRDPLDHYVYLNKTIGHDGASDERFLPELLEELFRDIRDDLMQHGAWMLLQRGAQ
jgi:hypothetical protein